MLIFAAKIGFAPEKTNPLPTCSKGFGVKIRIANL